MNQDGEVDQVSLDSEKIRGADESIDEDIDEEDEQKDADTPAKRRL